MSVGQHHIDFNINKLVARWRKICRNIDLWSHGLISTRVYNFGYYSLARTISDLRRLVDWVRVRNVLTIRKLPTTVDVDTINYCGHRL